MDVTENPHDSFANKTVKVTFCMDAKSNVPVLTISSWASFAKFIVPLYQQAFLIMIIVYVNYEIK
jgi:hypothetical protein